MNRLVASFLIVALTAGALLVVGCGEEEETKPQRSRGRRTQTPPPDGDGTNRQRPPEDMGPLGPGDGWDPGMEEPFGPGGGRRKPKGKQVQGPWATAKVGTTVRMKHSNGSTTVFTVIKANEKTVTCRIKTDVPGGEPIISTMVQARFMDENEIKNKYDQAGQRAGRRTITIGGKRLQCIEYRTRNRNGQMGRRVTERRLFCEEVPGWLVLHETDASGKQVVLTELVEYTE